MKLFKTEQKGSRVLDILLAVCLILGLILLYQNTGRMLAEQNAESIRQSILRTATQCYAVEGVYPSSLEYLEENYGLIVDNEHFAIRYSAFASNLSPDVRVVSR